MPALFRGRRRKGGGPKGVRSKWCVRYDWPNEDCEIEEQEDCHGDGMSRASAQRVAEGIKNSITRSDLHDRCAWGDWEALRNSVRVISMAERRRK